MSAEINSLTESPIVYPVRYHDISRELSLLAPLLQQQVTATGVSLSAHAGEHVKKDRPKKALVLVLGGLARRDARYCHRTGDGQYCSLSSRLNSPP
ncbi:hypothetical protein [Budvicia aquatica]|uniref:hypothetical protein n=1 Tax=Budvicia aquatica TaxID=82979 RepID=UPI00106AB5CB|nr:hypothetical protein [Budvicia aquatica]